MKVLKFGGTSVKEAASIKKAADIISSSEHKTAVVVSAFAGITNELVKITISKKDEINSILENIKNYHFDVIEKLKLDDSLKEFVNNEIAEIDNITNYLPLSNQLKDVVFTKGEILSSFIIFKYLEKIGVNVEHFDSREFIKTDANFTQAELNYPLTEKLLKVKLQDIFRNNDIAIGGGYISSDEEGRPTTLGRGGSDLSASIVASVMDADELQIWTDVDGILTSDPKIIPNAKRVLKLSYTEAAELSFFGAKVLHPKTIHPAVKKNIPVVVKNTFNPEKSGTYILHEKSNIKMIKAVAFRKEVVCITISSNRMLGTYGFLSRVFQIFESFKIPVDIVTTSEVSISVTVNHTEYMSEVEQKLAELGEVQVTYNNAIIAAIGEGIKHTAGIAGRFFGVLSGVNIHMVSLGASEVNLSIVVKESDLDNCIMLLHEEFFNKELDKETFAEIKE